MPGAGFQLRRVGQRFGAVAALQEIDLAIEPGEAVAFVGPSGAGKTTLLRLLNGSLRPTQGDVLIDGRNVDRLSRREMRATRTAIGFIPQDLGLVPNLRTAQNVMAGRLGRWSWLSSLRAMTCPSRRTLEEVLHVLERLGIGDKLFERSDDLSGGERQRVALARALFQQPSAVIGDEPVASVDPARARDLVELLTRVSSEEELTLCVSLHSLELAREFFPRLVGLRGGRIAFDRAPADVGAADFRALYKLTAAEA